MIFGLGTIIEIGSFIGFNRWKARQKTIENLQCGASRPRAIPILDVQVQKMAGNPTKFQRDNAARIAKVVRLITSTQAFEYALQGLMNPKSKLRKQRRRILEVSTYL